MGKLGFEIRVRLADGADVGFEDLTAAQRSQWEQNTVNRLSASMSSYYSNHPGEYEKLIGRCRK